MALSIVDADLDRPEHADAVRSLIASYARDPHGSDRDLPADVLDRLVPGLRAHPTTLVLLAFDGATAAGVAVCFRGYSTFAARPLLNVHDLVVLPAFRRRGVGRALLEHAAARARRDGCVKLTLEVREDNAPARALYARAGFGDADIGAGALKTLFLERRLDDV